MVGVVPFVTLIGIPVAWGIWVATGLWVVYRIVRGWIALVNHQPMPVST